jgi:hypothetical protein
MAKDRKIVHGDDERRPRDDGAAVARAVQDVDGARRVLEHERVPDGVARQVPRTGRAAECSAVQRDLVAPTKLAQQAVDVARGARLRLDERRRVERDLKRHSASA